MPTNLCGTVGEYSLSAPNPHTGLEEEEPRILRFPRMFGREGFDVVRVPFNLDLISKNP